MFQYVGSLQCSLVSLSGLFEGLTMWVFPPPSPKLGLPWMGQKGDNHSSPLCVLLWHGGVAPPMQVAPQRGQDILDCLLSPPGPTGQWTGQPSHQIYAMVEVSDLFVGGLVPTSFMAGTSASGSSLGRICQWPHQMNLSASFHPSSVACRNISWGMMDWWGPSISYLGYSSKNNLALSCHSASLIDSPASLACFLVDYDLCSLSP